MNKVETIDAAANGRGCLGRAKDDEPVFVLRANDPLAPEIVRAWALAYSKSKLTPIGEMPNGEIDRIRGKRDEAYKIADQMIAWRRRREEFGGA